MARLSSPRALAMVAFSLCTLVFLPAAFVHSRDSFPVLRRGSRDLVWVNVTSAIERHLPGAVPAVPLTRGERPLQVGLLASLISSAAVGLGGLSGAGAQPIGVTGIGIMLAAGGGISISVSTMLCRKLNDAGVRPSALLSLRYPATALSAAVLAALSPAGLPGTLRWVDSFMAIAALLIIMPSYVNQLGIALASPLTVRVVLATGPVLIFVGQLIEGRLSASPYSLASAILYAVAAISVGLARQRAIRSAIG